VLYKPASMVAGVLGGVVARTVFTRVWKLAAGEDEVPSPTDERYGWGEVLLAAALQGAVFAVVSAVVDRGVARGARKLAAGAPGDGADAAEA
jgi:Protein of unknown function (DUF4235)